MKERLGEIQKNLRRLSSSLTVGKRRASKEDAEINLTEADILRGKLMDDLGDFIHNKNALEEYLKAKPAERISEMEVNVADKAKEVRDVLVDESSSIEAHAELFKGWNAEERAIIYNEVFESFIEDIRATDTESAEADKSSRKEILKEMGMRSRKLSREEVMPELKSAEKPHEKSLSAEQKLEQEFKEFKKYLAQKNSAVTEDLEKLTEEVRKLLAEPAYKKSSAAVVTPESSPAAPKKDDGTHTPKEGGSSPRSHQG